MQKRISSDNSWWSTGEIPYYKDFSQRAYFERFLNGVLSSHPHRALVLMGPRRVGKTVMMYQAIQQLLDRGINQKGIQYFSLDTPNFTYVALEQLIQEAQLLSGRRMTHVFFDEIQYLKDWEIHLKSLVDTYRDVKFVASGSAAAALRMKSHESGAGRFTDFFLPPLTFHEYIDLNKLGDDLFEVEVSISGKELRLFNTENIKSLNQHFENYIEYGGFPEIALSKVAMEHHDRIIQKDITDKVIMRDLPGLFGIENVLELQQAFNVLAFRSGEIVTYKDASNAMGLDVKTLKKYLTYLEAAFLIKILNRTDVNAKRFKNVTQFKVYLTNPSLFTGLFGKVEQDHERFPHLVETAIFAQYLHRDMGEMRYARWDSGEVDLLHLDRTFSKAQWATEIKWSDRGGEGNIRYLMKKMNLPKAIITTKTVFKDGPDLLRVPSSLYAYTVGKNAVEFYS